jgi:ABC-type sugar transport system ATPase subunit
LSDIAEFPATPVSKEVLMKAFRSRPSIMINRRKEEKKAELTIQSLRLSFGGVIAVKDVDLKVHTGELMAIIGPNGAGKTSLLNCITGFYRAQQGKIIFNGKDITHLHTHDLVIANTASFVPAFFPAQSKKKKFVTDKFSKRS